MSELIVPKPSRWHPFQRRRWNRLAGDVGPNAVAVTIDIGDTTESMREALATITQDELRLEVRPRGMP